MLRLIVLAVLLTGCAATSLTDTWQAPDFQRRNFDNVLVVGVTPNITNRVLFETGFAEALQQKGIHAIASYNVIGDAAPTKESVTAYVLKGGIGYVVASQFGGVQITKEVVPESVRTYVVGPAYPSYDGYWEQASYTMVRDSYVDQKSEVMLTTTIFDASTKRPVWVGRSKTFELRSLADEANTLGRLVVGKISN
jgi:hypothetical protein